MKSLPSSAPKSHLVKEHVHTQILMGSTRLRSTWAPATAGAHVDLCLLNLCSCSSCFGSKGANGVVCKSGHSCMSERSPAPATKAHSRKLIPGLTAPGRKAQKSLAHWFSCLSPVATAGNSSCQIEGDRQCELIGSDFQNAVR